MIKKLFLIIGFFPYIIFGKTVDPMVFAEFNKTRLYNGNRYVVDAVDGNMFYSNNNNNKYIPYIKEDINKIKKNEDSVYVWIKANDQYIESEFTNYKKYTDDWYVLPITESIFDSLLSDSNIFIIQGVHKFSQSLDTAIVNTGTLELKRIGNNGQGVIVGIVDESVNTFMKGFIRGNKTRFKAIKNIYLNTEYYDDIPILEDTSGHGTAVLGICGMDDGKLQGFASQSEFVASIGSLWADDVLDGILWMDSLRAEWGIPFVFLVPLEHHWNMPFIESPEEEILDRIFNPTDKGKVCVVPAGNRGNANKVFSTAIYTGDTLNYSWNSFNTIFFNTGNESGSVLNVYYKKETGCKFRLLYKGDDNNYYTTDWIGADTNYIPYKIVSDSGDTILFLNGSDFFINDTTVFNYIYVQFLSNKKEQWLGIQLWGEENSEYIAVVPGEGYLISGNYLSDETIDLPDMYEIGVPGNAQNVITVSAVTNRLSWINADGFFIRTNGINNEIASWSSRGYPEAMKPDISAPGRYILTHWPQEAYIPAIYRSGSEYAIVSGTSASAGVVAGICAVLFSLQNDMDMQTLKNVFFQKPIQDINMKEWIYGKGIINVLASLVDYTIDMLLVNVEYSYLDNEIITLNWKTQNEKFINKWKIIDNRGVIASFNSLENGIYAWKGKTEGGVSLLAENVTGDVVYKYYIDKKDVDTKEPVVKGMRGKAIVDVFSSGYLEIFSITGRKIFEKYVANDTEIKLCPGLYLTKWNGILLNKFIIYP